MRFTEEQKEKLERSLLNDLDKIRNQILEAECMGWKTPSICRRYILVKKH